MRWSDGITNSVHMNLSKLQETEEPGMLQSMGSQSRTQLSQWTSTPEHPVFYLAAPIQGVPLGSISSWNLPFLGPKQDLANIFELITCGNSYTLTKLMKVRSVKPSAHALHEWRWMSLEWRQGFLTRGSAVEPDYNPHCTLLLRGRKVCLAQLPARCWPWTWHPEQLFNE